MVVTHSLTTVFIVLAIFPFRVLVLPDTTLFATCSNDGTVKIWDCDRMERRSVSNRSRQTYSRPDCQFVSLEVCQSCQSLACASNNGAIHVFRYCSNEVMKRQISHNNFMSIKNCCFRLESSTAKITTTLTRILDLQDEGCVVDMNYYDTGRNQPFKVSLTT